VQRRINYSHLICPGVCLWLTLGWFVVASGGQAQMPASSSQARRSTSLQLDRKYIQTLWTVQDGLAQNSVNAILQTRDGYLWMGTFGGLARFDGVKFTVFNSGNTPGLKSNRILSLYEDRAGTLWIGTETGEVMSLKDGRASTFTTANGLPGGLVWCFLEDHSGTLWIGTTRGLVHWQPDDIKIYTQQDGLAGNRVWSIYEDRPGHMWIGTDLGLVEFANGRGISRDPSQGVRVIHADPEGSLWLGTVGGIARLMNGRLITYPGTEGLPSQSIRALTRDRAGNIWAGYFDAAMVIRLQAGAFSALRGKIDLGAHAIGAMCTDSEGNLWVGTRGGGLVRLKERKLTAYASEDGLPGDSIQAITDDGADGIWAATSGGLAHISGGQEPKITAYTMKDGLPDNFLQALYRDRGGTLWIGCAGVTRFKDGKFTTYASAAGLSNNVVHAFAEDSQGNLWAGTEGGLHRFCDGRFVSYGTAQGLISDDVRFLLPSPDGSLWLGTIAGLSHFQNGEFTNYTSEQGLSNNYVRTILEQKDGTLWIGTYGGGLNRLKDGRFTPVTVKDGLFDDFISQIIEDDRGHFWMLSNRGIFHVDARELNDLADRRISFITCTSYGIADGMKSSEGNGGTQPAGCKAKDGKFWFATIKGLVAIDPELSGAILPPVMIEQVVIDRQALSPGQTVRIEPGQENLEIHYTGLSFSRPEQLRFKYRLNGLNQDWVDAGTRRVAYYSYIPPGEYVFSVIAASSEGVWNESATTLVVIVVPPFWRTWWFFALALLSLTGLLVLAYKRRVKHLKKAHAAQETFSKQLLESQERERQRIAAELHDGLGQSLLIIKNRAFLASSADGNRENTQEQLEEISASASQAIEEVREIAYNLRPYHLDRFGLTKTLKAIFTRFSDSSGTHFSVEIDPIDGLFSKEDEISIYRIVQESINNIVKHAYATEAQLVIRREAQTLRLHIQDNGKGFRPAFVSATEAQPGGFGLIGMAERVRMLKGSYLIDSTPGQGTTITIKLNIAEGDQ
jgi:signal transduction histidine kinase/ligand-binding sensor domain-containing protein